jgi:Rrf2 family cysteine metabolism transcriptional repressor
MLRISKKVEYALIGMLHMSMKKQEELTTAKELSACYNISLDLMGKVLQRLAKAGLIRSEQGAKGGYQLNKSMQDMSIGTILKVVDGPVKIVNCIRLEDHLNCEQESRCIIRNPMQVIQDRLDDFFGNLSLQNIRDEMIRQHVGGKLPVLVSGMLNRKGI